MQLHNAEGLHGDEGAHRQVQARDSIDRRVCISKPAAGQFWKWAEGMHKLVMMMMLTPAEVVIERGGLIQSSAFLDTKHSSRQASWESCARVQGLT